MVQDSFSKPFEFAKSCIKDRLSSRGASAWAGGKEAVCPSPLSLTQQISSPPTMTHSVQANSNLQSTGDAMTQWAKASSVEQCVSADSSTQGTAEAMAPFAKSSMSVPHVIGKAMTQVETLRPFGIDNNGVPVNAGAMVPFAKSTSNSPVTGEAMAHFGEAANSSPPVVIENVAFFAKATSRSSAIGEIVTQSHTFNVPLFNGDMALACLDHEDSTSQQSSLGKQPHLWQPENYWNAQEKPLAADLPPPTAKEEKRLGKQPHLWQPENYWSAQEKPLAADPLPPTAEEEKRAGEAFNRFCDLRPDEDDFHERDAMKAFWNISMKAFCDVSIYRARQNKNRHDVFGNRLDELPSFGLFATPGIFAVPKPPSHSEPEEKKTKGRQRDHLLEDNWSRRCRQRHRKNTRAASLDRAATACRSSTAAPFEEKAATTWGCRKRSRKRQLATKSSDVPHKTQRCPSLSIFVLG
jgi:hypothetical protein